MNENMGSFVNVSSSRFVSNHAGFGGGAMAVYDSEALIRNCTIDGNSVSQFFQQALARAGSAYLPASCQCTKLPT